MSREFSGTIKNISPTPTKDPQHFYVEYTDTDGNNRRFTVDMKRAIRRYFVNSARGMPITVTTHPGGAVAIVDINNELAYPTF